MYLWQNEYWLLCVVQLIYKGYKHAINTCRIMRLAGIEAETELAMESGRMSRRVFATSSWTSSL
jgi:hypothetical protein